MRQNVFSRGSLNRLSELRYDDEAVERLFNQNESLFVPVWNKKNLVREGEEILPRFLSKAEVVPLGITMEQAVFLGKLSGQFYFAFAITDEQAEQLTSGSSTFKDLREIGALLKQDEGNILSYARAIIYWRLTHRFCGRCGTPTHSTQAGHVLQCPNPDCGLKHFPRTDAAIILLITHEDQCLLVRQPSWPEEMFATVAGFLEPGESLEDAVAREVMEETGLELTNIQYHSSQPWPFPSSIMVGYTAQATHKNYKLDDREIVQALWLTREELTARLEDRSLRLPPPLSISRQLINSWYEKPSGQSEKN